jgi:putative ABC transport system permease protein
VRYIATDAYPLFPEGDFVYSVNSKVTKTTIGFMSGVENHITILEGNYPQPASPNGAPVEVLLHKNLADEAGFQVGEVYVVYVSDEWETGIESSTQFPVRIAGIWEPTDPTEDYWISAARFYEGVLFVPEETFVNTIDHYVPGAVFSAYWYFLMDGSHVFSADVQPLLRRISSLERYADNLLPNIRLAISPADSLSEYQQSSDLLTIMLYAFSVPIIGLILAFIGLVSRLAVERQRNEIAVLRSRGASPLQVLGFTIIEGIILGMISLGLGIPVAFLLTQWISRTQSFMQFSSGESVRVGISSEIIQIGLISVALVLIAMVVPAIGASRHTILTYKQERGRTVTKPWWQRAWMDVLIFIPAVYGTYLLQKQGSIVQISESGSGELLENPLLFLVPALGIFAMTLFSLRLIQPVMAGVSWLAGLTKNAGLTLASRQLSRSPSTYFTPLIILILTVSLSSYTASLAHTLDLHLYDRSYYSIGADLRFLDTGDTSSQGSSYAPTTQTTQSEESEPWVFIPIFEYLKIDGVKSAARFGRYQARAEIGSSSWESFFFGVDRVDFPTVAYWREDFA